MSEAPTYESMLPLLAAGVELTLVVSMLSKNKKWL